MPREGGHFDWANLWWVYSHGRVNLETISAASAGLMAREPLTWTAVIFIRGLMTTITPRILALHIPHSLWTWVVNCCFMWLNPGKRQPLIWTLLISKKNPCIFSPLFRVSCKKMDGLLNLPFVCQKTVRTEPTLGWGHRLCNESSPLCAITKRQISRNACLTFCNVR